MLTVNVSVTVIGQPRGNGHFRWRRDSAVCTAAYVNVHGQHFLVRELNLRRKIFYINFLVFNIQNGRGDIFWTSVNAVREWPHGPMMRYGKLKMTTYGKCTVVTLVEHKITLKRICHKIEPLCVRQVADKFTTYVEPIRSIHGLPSHIVRK